MTTVSSRAFSLLYGRTISTRDALVVGTFFGIAGYLLFESGLCAGEIPEIPLCLLIIPAVPFLFFLLAGPALHDIRNPRRPGVSFIAAISYDRRDELFAEVVHTINSRLILFVVVSLTENFILNAFFHHEKPQAWTLVPALASPALSCALSYGTVFLAQKGIIRPSKKDAMDSVQAGKTAVLRHFIIRTTWGLSDFIAAPLQGRVRVLVKRQLTDIFRANAVNSIVSPPFLILIAVLFTLVFKEAAEQVIQLIFIVGAYGMILLNSTTLFNSSLGFSRLPQYSFSMRELFLGNCYLIFILTGLFPIGYLLCIVFQIDRTATGIGLLQFLGSYLYLIVVSGAWHTLSAIPERTVFSTTLLYTYVIVVLLSVSIPFYGLLFPTVLIALLFALESTLVSKTVFHKEKGIHD